MTTTPTQHEAERLAQLLEAIDGQQWQVQDSAAEHLRRIPTLEAENAVLTAERDALRHDYQRLKASLAELEAQAAAVEKDLGKGLEREAKLMARCVELKDEFEAQRVPLTDEQIDAIGSERAPYTDFAFARAIEAAHGITPKGQG